MSMIPVFVYRSSYLITHAIFTRYTVLLLSLYIMTSYDEGIGEIESFVPRINSLCIVLLTKVPLSALVRKRPEITLWSQESRECWFGSYLGTTF